MKSDHLIMTALNPPISSVRKYLVLLEQSDRDVQEELELTELKSELVTKIRYNKQLEEDLDSWDTKIGLLIRNRLNVMDVVHTSSKLERRRLAARNQSNKGLQHFTKENKQMLEGYENLFYLLQTNSDYFAKLIFEMPSGKTTAFMQDVILTVFNYASTNREHFLLLQLFETALLKEVESKVERIDDVITGNPTVIKLIISFTRRMDYQLHSLKLILGPLVRKVLQSEDRISLNPVDIYKAWLSQTEIDTGESTKLPYEVSIVQALDHLEVRNRLKDAMEIVKNAADEFMDAIFSNINNLPYGLRYMACKLKEFLENKFPSADREDISKVVGNLLYYRFLNPVIAAPDAFEIVELEAGESLENEQRKKLGSIARILQHAASRKLFEGEYNCLDDLNPYIIKSYARFMEFFSQSADVCTAEEKFGITEYSDLVMLSRPVINISAKEVISTHKLLLAHLNAITEENDPLREVLKELGDTPDIRDLLGDIDDKNIPAEEAQERWIELGRQEIMLTLINKFENIPKDNHSLDTNAKFLETKGMIVDLMKVHPGDTLPEIVTSVHTTETEKKYDLMIEKFESQNNSETNLLKNSSHSHHGKVYTLSELKYIVRENLEFLDEQGVVRGEDGYQNILNAIARDIRNQHRYRRERRCEKDRLNQAISQLDNKHVFLEEQFEYYQLYVRTATANMSKTGHKGAPKKDVQVVTSPVDRGDTFTPKSIRYTAQKLFEKGILIEIEGVSRTQFKTLQFEIVSVSHGSFDINAKMFGLAAEKVNLVFEDLLQLRFENVQIMKILDRVKVNVNLLIYLLNKKFYGR
ncbi:Ras GTPase-activating-like IQGAP1 [Oopsacas minuta]|uniref:Ras GTPase-activating-like IQGAP1 n=1 Tax=Oopsacas minuta TaxID=111878 RepID=A0AAV7KK96_9METZ|nr:Ras GTPase-activating-like IQGAP1 [Oopsacas minuta]